MAQLRKRVRLANPRRKRRKLSLAQIRAGFGGKRRKTALKRKRSTSSSKRKTTRRKNVGVIYTALAGVGNPGRKKGAKSMARRRRRNTKRRVRRVRHNPVANPRRRRRRTRTVVRYRTRNSRRRHTRRRRNPSGMFSTPAKQVVGVLGGAAVTKLIVDRLPYGLNAGIPGYIATAVVAVIQGWAVGKFGKQRALGSAMQLGGFTYLGLRVMQDFFPSLATITPIGLRGMGVIGPSSFYQPQAPRPNRMTSFVPPRALSSAVAAAGMAGLGRRVPRMGRVA